jgi:hypothetical protein
MLWYWATLPFLSLALCPWHWWGRRKERRWEKDITYEIARHMLRAGTDRYISERHSLSTYKCAMPAAPMRSIVGSWTVVMRLEQLKGPLLAADTHMEDSPSGDNIYML